jgi:hypothetical protein
MHWIHKICRLHFQSRENGQCHVFCSICPFIEVGAARTVPNSHVIVFCSIPLVFPKSGVLRTVNGAVCWLRGWFLTWLQFRHYLCKFEKLPCKSLEGICNVDKSQENFPQFLLEVRNFLLQVPNFLFCSARCNWLTKIIHQWQRSEQNRN